jgi:hypothetical protein
LKITTLWFQEGIEGVEAWPSRWRGSGQNQRAKPAGKTKGLRPCGAAPLMDFGGDEEDFHRERFFS